LCARCASTVVMKSAVVSDTRSNHSIATTDTDRSVVDLGAGTELIEHGSRTGLDLVRGVGGHPFPPGTHGSANEMPSPEGDVRIIGALP